MICKCGCVLKTHEYEEGLYFFYCPFCGRRYTKTEVEPDEIRSNNKG